MSDEHREESYDSSADKDQQASDTGQPGNKTSSGAGGQPATVLVRGETIRSDKPQGDQPASKSPRPEGDKPSKPVSAKKSALQSRLPALEDDADVGVLKDHVVTRDGKADLAFNGTLVASAAPSSAPKGTWDEYRVYETGGGKHVFSKISRSIYAEDQDKCEAEVFDPSPAGTTSALLRSARDLTRSHPVQWTDAAVSFFGYDPLAKELYRKLGSQFEEHIN